jgi:hypothetical protein
MTPSKQSIFRAKAVEQYWQKRETTVLPAYLVPKFFGLLWLGVAALMVAGAVSWMIEIPVLAAGSAIVAPLPDSSQVVIVVFVPSQFASQVEEGQTLTIRSMSGPDKWTQPLVGWETAVLTPAQIEAQFGVDLGVAAQPMAAMMVPLATEAGGTAVLTPNVIYQAEIKIGARPVLSLFPVIGQFFEEDV